MGNIEDRSRGGRGLVVPPCHGSAGSNLLPPWASSTSGVAATPWTCAGRNMGSPRWISEKRRRCRPCRRWNTLHWNLTGSWLLDLPHPKSSPMTGTVWDAEGEAMRGDRERGTRRLASLDPKDMQQRRPRLCCAKLRCRLPRERE